MIKQFRQPHQRHIAFSNILLKVLYIDFYKSALVRLFLIEHKSIVSNNINQVNKRMSDKRNPPKK